MSWLIREHCEKLARERGQYYYGLNDYDKDKLREEVERVIGSGPHDIFGRKIKVGDTVTASFIRLEQGQILVGEVTNVDEEKDNVTVKLIYHPCNNDIGKCRTYPVMKRFLILPNGY